VPGDVLEDLRVLERACAAALALEGGWFHGGVSERVRVVRRNE
jgi:hypothetical protein